jgi:hypothetical protein
MLTVLNACSIGKESVDWKSVLRGAEDVPDHFLVGSFSSTATEEPSAGTGCHSPMIDPRNGGKLLLVRSAGGRGDYEVGEGGYGLREGELLRLDCGTGRVMGIVRR